MLANYFNFLLRNKKEKKNTSVALINPWVFFCYIFISRKREIFEKVSLNKIFFNFSEVKKRVGVALFSTFVFRNKYLLKIIIFRHNHIRTSYQRNIFIELNISLNEIVYCLQGHFTNLWHNLCINTKFCAVLRNLTATYRHWEIIPLRAKVHFSIKYENCIRMALNTARFL